MNFDVQQLNGACHCGTVRFNVKLKNGLHTARRCTCSYCQLKGAVAVSAAKDGVTIVSGGESLTKYQFNTNAAEHYFCSKCGIYTFHKPRSEPDFYGVNAACLEGDQPVRLRRIARQRRHQPSYGHQGFYRPPARGEPSGTSRRNKARHEAASISPAVSSPLKTPGGHSTAGQGTMAAPDVRSVALSVLSRASPRCRRCPTRTRRPRCRRSGPDR